MNNKYINVKLEGLKTMLSILGWWTWGPRNNVIRLLLDVKSTVNESLIQVTCGKCQWGEWNVPSSCQRSATTETSLCSWKVLQKEQNPEQSYFENTRNSREDTKGSWISRTGPWSKCMSYMGGGAVQWVLPNEAHEIAPGLALTSWMWGVLPRLVYSSRTSTGTDPCLRNS